MLVPGRFQQLQQQLQQLQQQHARLVGAAAGQPGAGQAKGNSRPASPSKGEQGLVAKQVGSQCSQGEHGTLGRQCWIGMFSSIIA